MVENLGLVGEEVSRPSARTENGGWRERLPRVGRAGPDGGGADVGASSHVELERLAFFTVRRSHRENIPEHPRQSNGDGRPRNLVDSLVEVDDASRVIDVLEPNRWCVAFIRFEGNSERLFEGGQNLLGVCRSAFPPFSGGGT